MAMQDHIKNQLAGLFLTELLPTASLEALEALLYFLFKEIFAQIFLVDFLSLIFFRVLFVDFFLIFFRGFSFEYSDGTVTQGFRSNYLRGFSIADFLSNIIL